VQSKVKESVGTRDRGDDEPVTAGMGRRTKQQRNDGERDENGVNDNKKARRDDNHRSRRIGPVPARESPGPQELFDEMSGNC
jgi:hypothetical protein